ncbi:hypothetical protein CPIN18021_1673 [Campylobacter pinnipediorum subsp. caledonicus]|uniref:Uncharacterized protein n=1 Tax=Campylobacter pinnipediorum subsp. caledonicus TaxID=1874362 RepID=A0A1S6U9P4_9BACT|nr:hypothetical protein [Campylobacter pinnipediorum]AQW86796.1 hypothetical protein CPIN18020_1619 [Campylobacter pinnipediorum subsp. caledonicus]AQW88451.1 hypothetical protein CPIN18021_1673 [Campylobacter pinnipediorum subsp. caledonicus]OPA72584.1 hypothetical protein BB381_05135 [Campylobacter pinnipediorum subsp. caledonicus]
MEKLYEILRNINDEIDYEVEEHLIDDAIFSSFEILESITAFEEEFGITIPIEYIVEENFQSAKAMHKMINKLQHTSPTA